MGKWALPKGWEWISIPDICQINPRRPRLQRDNATPTSFVPMQSIDELHGVITAVLTRSYEEVKRGYTYFEEDDVLMAKITPSMENGKVAIARNLIDRIGFGSTEFHVFRPNEGITPEWIFYYLRRKTFRNDAKRAFRGAVGQQRVPEDFLYVQSIPIPYPNDPERSLAEQRRIVARLEALLGEVREMRALAQSMQEDIERVMEAALAEVFSQNTDWPIHTIDEIADVKGGKRLPKGETFADTPTPYPYIRVKDFQNYSVDTSNLRYLKPETYERIRRYTISQNDIFISIAGTIGLVGTVPPELDGANLTENAAKIVFKPEFRERLDKEFLVFYLASPMGKKQIDERSKAAGQPKLALMRIKTIEVPVPTRIETQKEIVAYIKHIVQEVATLTEDVTHDIQAIDQLEQSILAAAFRGEV